MHVFDETDAAIVAAEQERRRRIRQWRSQARPEQLPPAEGDWYVRGGRGSGKTWTGSRTLAEWAQLYPGTSWGVVAPTYADARDKCIEGESGLLTALGTNRVEVEGGRSALVSSWNRSLHDLHLRNGSVIWADGADDGAPTIQGENLAGVWADEVGLWKLTKWRMAWEESITFAIRKYPARIVATGTPKRGHPLVKLLMSNDRWTKTVMSTTDNIANLAPSRVEELLDTYGGTTIGRQELEGEYFEDAEGTLWRRDIIGYKEPPSLGRVVVAVDPAATSGMDADETGIVGAGIDPVGLGYVLADESLRGTPDEWGRAVVRLYRRLSADMVVAEQNNGGEMVKHVIQSVDAGVPVKLVHASRGKHVRAEPVAAKYEQHRIFHSRPFPDLEDQMVTWQPQHEASGDKSPDRVDALVWGFTELMVTGGSWAGGHGGVV